MTRHTRFIVARLAKHSSYGMVLPLERVCLFRVASTSFSASLTIGSKVLKPLTSLLHVALTLRDLILERLLAVFRHNKITACM